MLNIVTMFAIRGTSSLPKTLKTLLLSLAVSDAGVGLLGQPLYISLLVMWLQQSDPGCNTYKGFAIVSWSVGLASFFGVVAVSVDRFFLLFLICYLPHCIVLVVYQINGPSIPLKMVLLFSWTLGHLNSSLNPVIYCWKMAPIRHAVMDILRNMFWFRNGTSH